MHSFAIHGVNACGDNNEIYVAWLPGCNVAALPPIQVIQKRFSTVEFWGVRTPASRLGVLGAHACFTFGAHCCSNVLDNLYSKHKPAADVTRKTSKTSSRRDELNG